MFFFFVFIIHIQLVSDRGAAVDCQVSASLRLTVSIEIEKKWYSWEVIDSYVGLELEGRIDFTVDLRIVAGLRFVAMLRNDLININELNNTIKY